MKAYKGFNKDMTCRDFQYEEGKDYETDKAKICKRGFHACGYPLDCFNYYDPCNSVFHEVDIDGDIQKYTEDTKICGKHIHVGARLSVAGIVKAAIEFTMSRINPEANSDERNGASSATGYKGASSATGNCGASSATGYKGASSATGYYGASSATGYYGASSATGDYGASSATGYKGASSATGYKGASSATGDYGASSATGNCGASSATGYKSCSVAEDPCAIAVAWGYHGRVKGVIGSHLVLAEWEGDENNYWTQDEWTLKGAKMERVDGERIKADTWYTMKDGKFCEVEDENRSE